MRAPDGRGRRVARLVVVAAVAGALLPAGGERWLAASVSSVTGALAGVLPPAGSPQAVPAPAGTPDATSVAVPQPTTASAAPATTAPAPVPPVRPADPGTATAAGLPTLPPRCRPAPGWVDATPDEVRRPGAGLTVRVWRGRNRSGTPVQVTAAEAGADRVRLEVVAPRSLGQRLPTSDLTARAGGVAGLNADYFSPGPGGDVPRNPLVVAGEVRFAPGGATRAVGVDEAGRWRAGPARVEGLALLGNVGLPVVAVNVDRPPARGVTLLTAAGARQPVRAAWYVVVRAGQVVASQANRPRLRAGDQVLAVPASGRRALAAVRPGVAADVRVAVTVAGVPVVEAAGMGFRMLARSTVLVDCRKEPSTWVRPRSAVGWDEATGRTWFVTVNSTGWGGAAPGVRGITYAETADLLRRLGATDAVMLDGGHSATLAVRRGTAVVRADVRPDAPQRPVVDAFVLVPVSHPA